MFRAMPGSWRHGFAGLLADFLPHEVTPRAYEMAVDALIAQLTGDPTRLEELGIRIPSDLVAIFREDDDVRGDAHTTFANLSDTFFP